MKTSNPRILAAFFASALLMSALAQTPPNGAPDDNNTNAPGAAEPADAPPDASAVVEMLPVPPDAPPVTAENGAANGPETAPPAPAPAPAPAEDKPAAPVADASPAAAPEAFAPPTQATGSNPDELRLNFRNAPLEMVLNYLSDAAGFIIVLDTQVRGTVNVISSHPMTKDEAVDLLNSVLNKNGYAAIRDGRTLTIVSKESAKTRDIPVKVSSDPNSIPKNDEIVTQIIPIRFVEARQLVSDLSTFVSPQATVVANEAGNSIVITDTQANIRHLTEIIRAIDSSAESETEIRVFRLKHANPTDVANLLAGIFPSNASGNNTQTPIRFGGFGGFGGGGRFGGFGGGGAANAGAAGNSSSDRIKKAQQVVAVADLRTSSVVVTAAKDLMEQISGMISELDVNSTRDQKVYVFHMDNGDPQQAVQVLQNMFQSSSTTRSGSSSSASSQNSALMTREQNNASSSSSTVNGSSSTSSGFGGSGGSRSGGGAGATILNQL